VPDSTAGVAGLFEREGASRESSGARPLLLDGDLAWIVASGRVDVFAVAVRGGVPVGSRTHLFRVDEGGLLLGTGAPGSERAVGLLAVGGHGTRLLELPRRRLREAAAAPGMAALLDGWVDGLFAGISRGVSPAGIVEVETGSPVSADGEAVHARPARGVAWVRHEAGSSLLLGRPGLKMNGTGWVPLSHRGWMQVGEHSRLVVEPTPKLIGGDEVWDGLDRLHALVLACTVQLDAEAGVRERARLAERAATRRRVFTGSFSSLSAILDGSRGPAKVRVAAPRPDTGGDPLLAAVRLVGEAAGVQIRPPPRTQGVIATRDPIAAIAAASRLRTRRVMLRDEWWREDGGPLLAYTEAGSPVALIPAPGTTYVLHDPAAERQARVTPEVAAELAPVAFSFYRPFPDSVMSARALVRFGLEGCGGDLWAVLAMGTAAGLLSLVTPYATGLIFNDIIPGAERGQLLQLTLILLSLAVATALFQLVNVSALVRIEGRMGGRLQAAVWDRLLSLPMPFFRPYSAGALANRAMGIDQMRQLLSGATVTALLGGLFSLFHFGLLFHYSPKLAWWAALLIAVAVACAVLASWIQLFPQRRVADLQSRLAGLVLQFLTSVSKLRVAGAEVQAFSIWAREFGLMRRLSYRVRSAANVLTGFNAGYPVVAYLVIYAVAHPLLMPTAEKPMQTGDFLAFVSSFGICLSGLLSATLAVLGTLAVVPLYEQAAPILTTPPEVDPLKGDPGALSGDIELQQVVFRYQTDGPQVLRGVTLRIRAGEFVAFVGPSGSGKSTLLRLLLGFETPESGAVYYDGQDLSGVDVQALRRQIGVVLQSGRLMSGDLFTNIVGASSATLDDAWEAARMAGLEDDINAMPMGMHTVISEGGGTLSGGQRQRLLIARAIVQRPRILYFDEATSALDNRTQAIVGSSLQRLQATRVVVAHRLSTILHADTIYVVHGGEIVEKGNYQSLMALGGHFTELAKRQLA
jgi:ATP-binding cassette subfamily C protein